MTYRVGKSLVAAFTAAGITLSASATTFYAECGAATSGDGSAASPFNSMADAIGAAAPGDTIAVRGAIDVSDPSQCILIPADKEGISIVPWGDGRLAITVNASYASSAGALTHIATFPMAALRKCRFEFGESVLVMGQGILGQLAVLLARAAGAAPVIAADPAPAKRERARALGADLAFDPSAPEFAQGVKDATGGGARVVVEVTGVDRALDNALDAVARFGRVALLGCTRHSTFAIDYYRKVHGRGVTLVGAHTMARPKLETSPGWWTERDDALVFLCLLNLGRLSLDNFVEEVHPVSDAPAVYARLAAGGPFPIVQFDWTIPCP